MNFYKHHIGDYEAATSHLSLIEDAIYSRMMRRYYLQEAPLPVEVEQVARLIRARDQVDTCKAILIEFFYLADDGWHHKRCDEEIAAANAQAETNRRIAQEREAKKRRTTTARSVHDSSNESLHEDSTSAGFEREPSQTPDSNSQTPSSASQTEAGRACRLMKDAGCHGTNPAHPQLIDALIAGVTPEELADTVREAIEVGIRKPFPWAIATARGRRAEGVRPLTGAPRATDRNVSAFDATRAAVAGDLTSGGFDEPRDSRLVG